MQLVPGCPECLFGAVCKPLSAQHATPMAARATPCTHLPDSSACPSRQQLFVSGLPTCDGERVQRRVVAHRLAKLVEGTGAAGRLPVRVLCLPPVRLSQPCRSAQQCAGHCDAPCPSALTLQVHFLCCVLVRIAVSEVKIHKGDNRGDIA